jgi:predicted nucleotidyltransferase
MKFEQSRLISYASSFVSYLIKKVELRDLENIKAIYLFGSVTRGDIKKTSDVDIFIETNFEIKNLDKIKASYFKTIWFKNWEKLGITNEINLISGKLGDWKLKSSIEASGIILFGHHTPSKFEKWELINWTAPKDAKKRVELQRKIFGYWGKSKRYIGLIEKEGWKRINSSAIIVKSSDQVLDVLHKLKVRYELSDVYLRK